MKLFQIGLLAFICAVCSATDRTLVLLDNWGIRETHSQYFRFLKESGFDLTFKTADDRNIALFKYGERNYDNVILFCPSVSEFGNGLSVQDFTSFIDQGGNIMMGANSQIEDQVRELASECGVEYDEAKTNVIDHMSYNVQSSTGSSIGDDGRHTLVVADAKQLIDSKVIVGKPSSPLLFRGVGLVADSENPLVYPILRASSTSYSYNPDQAVTDYPLGVGKNLLLIAGLQARNNARVVLSGSIDFFSDNFWSSAVHKSGDLKTHEKAGNEDVAKSISLWAFKHSGVLRYGNVQHHLAKTKTIPKEYTITEDVEYSIDIEELKNGKWVPLEADDVQLEFIRIDPFVRTALKRSGKRFSTLFKLPDVYGVFKFSVDFNRIGYTFMSSVTQVSVRPFTHLQYERFIPCAFPYYASAFSMMVGVVLFSFVFLYYKDPSSKPKSE